MANQTLSSRPIDEFKFSHFRIIKEIGSCGIGVVFRAQDEHLDGELVTKFVPSDTPSDSSVPFLGDLSWR